MFVSVFMASMAGIVDHVFPISVGDLSLGNRRFGSGGSRDGQPESGGGSLWAPMASGLMATSVIYDLVKFMMRVIDFYVYEDSSEVRIVVFAELRVEFTRLGPAFELLRWQVLSSGVVVFFDWFWYRDIVVTPTRVAAIYGSYGFLMGNRAFALVRRRSATPAALQHAALRPHGARASRQAAAR